MCHLSTKESMPHFFSKYDLINDSMLYSLKAMIYIARLIHWTSVLTRYDSYPLLQIFLTLIFIYDFYILIVLNFQNSQKIHFRFKNYETIPKNISKYSLSEFYFFIILFLDVVFFIIFLCFGLFLIISIISNLLNLFQNFILTSTIFDLFPFI